MTSKLVLKFTYVFIFLFGISTFCQQKVFKGDPDRAFEVARNLAFNKERKKAQDTLLFILTKYPDYHDIRVFLGTTYSWDGDYKLAQKEFSYVLEKDPKRKDTWIAAINNELWAETPFKALKMAEEALKYYPNDPEILYKKASAEENSNQLEKALFTVDLILKEDPNNQKAIDYRAHLIQKLSFNVIGVTGAVSVYSVVYDPAQYYGFKYGRKTKYVSILAKVNYSRRFETSGLQFELDLYPKIAKGLYAYLNIGYSDTSLFPKLRYGAELHKSLPKSFEVSLGFRALEYTSFTTIYTGSISWYTGNSYWSFRPYFTPGDSGVSKSGSINYRKYRSDADNYLSITAGMGFSPEFYRFDIDKEVQNIVDLNSQKFSVGYYFTSSKNKNAWGAQAGVIHQELSFDPGNYYWMYALSLSWEMKFR